MRSPFFSLVWLITASASAFGQFAPPDVFPPSEEVLRQITERTKLLEGKLQLLRQRGVSYPALADLEVFHKAAVWIVRHGEFFDKASGGWTLDVLDQGLLRAAQAARGDYPWLYQRGHTVARAYRSRIDGSIQPFSVTFPEDYGKDPSRRWRIDVVLHGRNGKLTEVSFLKQQDGRKAAADLSAVVLEVYGRGNNAYRWAGEVDVFEALDAFLATEQGLGRGQLLDESRLVLRGFSMGGAGTWHIGLHHPDRWAVIGPGAGFTTTIGYAKGLPEKLPPYQEACLHIYDAVDYAENAFNVPVVAYSGSEDAQKQAADNIEQRLRALGIPMTHLIAPGLGHKLPPEWQQKAEKEYAGHVARGRREYPKKIRFVTYTLQYDRCHWVQLLGLQQHYREARVEAEKTEGGYRVSTKNVRALRLALEPQALREPVAVEIDGQKLEAVPAAREGVPALFLERQEGGWAAALPERLLTDRLRRPQKSAGLQGPIDHAFMGAFVCVRGTGQAWHKETQEYHEGALRRFQQEWSKYHRGELPVMDDADVGGTDIASRHLILFGDPASNSLVRQVLPRLPLTWTKEEVGLEGGRKYKSGECIPVLIYPSPLNPSRYVVLGSGHTFGAREFQGTNALLFPRLGDYAVLKRVPTATDPLATEPAEAGLFDDFWKLPVR